MAEIADDFYESLDHALRLRADNSGDDGLNDACKKYREHPSTHAADPSPVREQLMMAREDLHPLAAWEYEPVRPFINGQKTERTDKQVRLNPTALDEDPECIIDNPIVKKVSKLDPPVIKRLMNRIQYDDPEVLSVMRDGADPYNLSEERIKGFRGAKKITESMKRNKLKKSFRAFEATLSHDPPKWGASPEENQRLQEWTYNKVREAVDGGTALDCPVEWGSLDSMTLASELGLTPVPAASVFPVPRLVFDPISKQVEEVLRYLILTNYPAAQ